MFWACGCFECGSVELVAWELSSAGFEDFGEERNIHPVTTFHLLVLGVCLQKDDQNANDADSNNEAKKRNDPAMAAPRRPLRTTTVELTDNKWLLSATDATSKKQEPIPKTEVWAHLLPVTASHEEEDAENDVSQCP